MTADDHGRDLRVAVLGTGIMGSAMAGRLVAAGLATTVWDRSPSAAAPLGQAGALVAETAAEAARDAGVVITMLPSGLGADGHHRRRGYDRDRCPARRAAA